MSYLHTVIMAHGLMLLLCVYSRNERISVFQIQMQSKNYISKCNPDPKNKSCLNQSPITGIRLGLYIIQLRGATSSSFRGGGNFHEISFDDVIVFIQPWCNFFANGHI